MDFDKQVKTITTMLGECDTPEERRTVFMMYTMDMSFDRGAILTAMKSLKIENDFSIRQAGEPWQRQTHNG